MLEVMVIYGIFTDVAVTSNILAFGLFRFGIQIVLGVPYNILKFKVDMMNTLGEIDIQNLGPPRYHIFTDVAVTSNILAFGLSDLAY